MKFLDILKTLGPAILMLVPGAQPFIPLIVAGMTLAEESQKPGVEKKAIALQAVQVGATAANLIAKRDVINPVTAVAVATDTIDAIVGAINLIQASKLPEALGPSSALQPV